MEPQRRLEPEWIGRYRVLGRLGCGGMGEVFLAWDDQLKRKVAVKRIRQDGGLTPEQRERFQREAELAASVCHPFIVQVHEVVIDETGDAIVMEYVEGRTIESHLAARRLEMPEILRLALEIAQGLHAAHQAGLVHRDLKAANVIITSGYAKILDFGLARPMDRAPEDPGFTRPGIIRGTPHAMSPEQARGEEVDERSDLFSFGALLHEMLTGHPPFRGKDDIESMWRVGHREPVHPLKARPDLPDEAAWLLLWLLMKDRDKRPDSAREVIEILERLQTVRSTPPSVAPEKSVSELPTEEDTILDLPERPHQEPLPSPPGGPVAGLPASSPYATSQDVPLQARRRIPLRRRVVLAVATLVLAAGAAFLLLAVQSTRPLRVAVILKAPPQDPELKRAASAVRSAVLQALTRLEGITPVAPEEVIRVDGAPVEIGKAVSAEEVLPISLERADGTALVTIEKITVRSGEVQQSFQFYVPLGRRNRLTLANVVIGKTQKIFSEPEQPGFIVEEDDFAAFMDIQEQVDAGKVRREDLGRLEEMFRTNPDFLEAPILASRIALSLYLSRREPADLERASTLIGKARFKAPEDPRMLRQELQIALARDLLGEAEDILDKLAEIEPGDPEILPLRADLAEKQGRLVEAKTLYTEAVEQVPSWQNRYLLANFEARHGGIDAARAQITEILRQGPRNVWAQAMLGEIEMSSGDPAQAERIYQDLAQMLSPPVPERVLSNLGTVRYMRGNLEGAADAYRRALATAPEYPPALTNLAEIELELGKEREAEELYRQALAGLEKLDADLSTYYGLLKAQCLARLGRSREAVEIARKLSPKAEDSPSLLFQLVLVYSLAGEQALALEHAKAALARGLQPRWFTGSAFQWLRESLELRSYFRSSWYTRSAGGFQG